MRAVGTTRWLAATMPSVRVANSPASDSTTSAAPNAATANSTATAASMSSLTR